MDFRYVPMAGRTLNTGCSVIYMENSMNPAREEFLELLKETAGKSKERQVKPEIPFIFPGDFSYNIESHAWSRYI